VLQFGGAGDKSNTKIWGKNFSPLKCGITIYQKRFELESSNFLWRRSSVGSSLCWNLLSIGAKLSPQLRFEHPQEKSLEGYNSITIAARTLKFGMLVATGRVYPKWDLGTNRITTAVTRRGFPIHKVPTGFRARSFKFCLIVSVLGIFQRSQQ